jgi:hypothetical protein
VKQFDIDILVTYRISADEVWPDGDAPPNPTAQDVIEVINNNGGPVQIITDWNLDADLNVNEVAIMEA